MRSVMRQVNVLCVIASYKSSYASPQPISTMKNIFVCLVVAVTMSACATHGANQNLTSKTIQAGNGILIASVTNSNANYLNGVNQFPPELTFVNSLGGEEVVLKGLVGTVFDKHLVNEKNWAIGRVVSVEVKAGTYRFKSFSTPQVAYHLYAKSKEATPLCFTVAPGEVAYIGNLDILLNPKSSSYELKATDMSDRDFSHVSEKWPKLFAEPIVKRLAGSSC